MVRWIFVGIGVLAVVGGLILGAWVLEGGIIISKPGAKVFGGEFVAELPPRVGIDLVLQCNEEFFQEAYQRFRKEHLGIETDPIAVPGGVKALVAIQGDLPKEFEPVKRAIVEALKRHSPRHVVLTAHSQCLLYDVIAAWQNKGDEVMARQLDDLHTARTIIRSWFPNAQVDIYYAQQEGGDRLRFKPILKEETKK
ncbi:MAG: hypothetical protein Q7K16_00605 [Candidatus Azambacteria bacterium]|nr:hypothetical protein [Candidatus Azambacteria bacterium]